MRKSQFFNQLSGTIKAVERIWSLSEETVCGVVVGRTDTELQVKWVVRRIGQHEELSANELTLAECEQLCRYRALYEQFANDEIELPPSDDLKRIKAKAEQKAKKAVNDHPIMGLIRKLTGNNEGEEQQKKVAEEVVH